MGSSLDYHYCVNDHHKLDASLLIAIAQTKAFGKELTADENAIFEMCNKYDDLKYSYQALTEIFVLFDHYRQCCRLGYKQSLERTIYTWKKRSGQW